MNKKVFALNDYILCMEEEGQEKTRGGIIIPDSKDTSRSIIWAKVVKVSKDIKAVVEGDSILFNKEMAETVTVEEVGKCLVIKEGYLFLREGPEIKEEEDVS